jgi:Apea-like HEPN
MNPDKTVNNQSSDLYRAMREYIQAALQFLASVCPVGPSRIVKGRPEWKRDSDKFFRLHDREEPFWAECIQFNLEKLHALDEYHRLDGIIRAIPEINLQLDNLVGTELGGLRIEINNVIDRLIWRLPQISGGLSFDEDHFNSLFNSLDADLRRTSIPHVLLAPLLGLKVEQESVELSSEISITYMTDDEIVRCLDLGVLSDLLLWPGLAHVDRIATVRVQFSLDKRVGVTAGEPNKALKVYSDAREQAVEVLYVLRVFKEGRVSVPAFVKFSPHWPLEGQTNVQHSNPGPMPRSNKYELSLNEVEEFKAFWKQIQQGAARRAAGNAVRRFSFASDRERDDDKIVDLMIAAESLFLADSGSPQERGELRYRCALRAAFFIEVAEYSRREILKHMLRAYDVRSAIVHGGGEIDNKLLKSRTDESLSLQDFVKITESFIRSALRKRIQIAATTGTTFMSRCQ